MSLISTTIRTSTILFFSQVVSAAILATTSVSIARLLLPASFGLYSIALVPLYFVQPIRDWGIPTGLQQKTSEYKGSQNLEKVRPVILSSGIFVAATGIVLSAIIILILPGITISTGNENIAPLIAATIPLVSFTGIYKISYSFFIGLDRPIISAGLLVGSSVTKFVLSVGLVLVGFGVFGALIGFSLSFTGTAIISIVLLYRAKNQLPRDNEIPIETRESVGKDHLTLFSIVKFSSPIGIADISHMMLDTLLLIVGIIFLSQYDYGVYSASRVLYIQIVALFTPFVLSLISAFSKMASKTSEEASDDFKLANQMSAIPISTLGAILIISAEPLVLILYGIDYLAAGTLLAIFCLTYVLLAPFGCFSLPPLMLANNLVGWYGITNTVSACVSVLLAVLLVPIYGYTALAFLVVLAMFIRTILQTLVVKVHLNVVLNIRRNFRLLAAILLPLIIAVVIRTIFLSFNTLIVTGISLIIFTGIYLIVVIRFSAITLIEIEMLHKSIGSSQIFSRLMSFFLRLIKTVGSSSAE